MTESKRGRTATPKPGTATEMEATPVAPSSAVAPSTDVTPREEPEQVRSDKAGPPMLPRTLRVRLPFVTVTLSGPQTTEPPAAVVPARDVGPLPGGTLEKVVFYGGVATMGAIGALEWPVVAAVAAGTWVAQHTAPIVRTTPEPAPSPQPATSPQATETEQTTPRRPVAATAPA
jgi:hypothetical protein